MRRNSRGSHFNRNKLIFPASPDLYSYDVHETREELAACNAYVEDVEIVECVRGMLILIWFI